MFPERQSTMNGRGADLTGKVVVMGEQRNGRASALAFPRPVVGWCSPPGGGTPSSRPPTSADRAAGVAHVVTIDVTVDGDLALPAR
jgi:hypothetical protein